MSKSVERLFEQFQPASYDLLIDVDDQELIFKGTVIIRGKKVGRPSQRLTFHQKDLKVKAASILKHGKTGSENIPIKRINSQDSADEIRLHTDDLVYPGEYSVSLEFEGKITKQMHGIYPCFFKDKEEDKRLIATQFESHHAREAFPCIDEPEAKATFDLKLVTPAGMTVLANTPLKHQETENERQRSTFETSPIMSTYLLAFVFGDMHSVSAKTKDGVIVSSWATVAQPVEHLRYANDEAVKILEFFSDYFQTPFPLKKLDQVALPDFDSLAMENWGLITFREVGLLADPINRSLSSEQLITLVVAHELSHQWFGNLVTMKWWDDLWLNESFASIMENIAPDKLHPDWNQWEDFATSRVLSCSHRDIYKDVQPVGVTVKHPDEISTLFDPAIVYAKGARLLTMLYEYLGEDTFRKGLQNYFKKHAYQNTTRQDLWDSFAAVSQHDIKALMTPWIEQSGQPKLSVKREKSKLLFKQERFLLDGEDVDSLWPIPFLSDTPLEPDILSKREGSYQYAADEKIPLFNINGSGHYIVDYRDDEAKRYIQEKVEDRSLPSIGRITVLNDMLLLARAGEYELSSMLEMIAKCDDEPRDAVWSMFSRIIGQTQTLTDGRVDIEPSIRNYKNDLAKHWYEKLGWQDKDSDDPNTKHLRTTALALSIAGENQDALSHALEAMEKAGSVTALTAEQRGMIATVAVRHGQPTYVSQFMDEYTSSQNPDVQAAITSALCSTRDPSVARKLIEWGLKPGGVIRQQDIDHWFAYLMRNHYTRNLAWDWFESGWDYLAELFSGGKHMEYFVWYSAGPLSNRDWQEKFKAFFEPKMDEPALKRNIAIALSEIEARVQWREREEGKLVAYYNKFSQLHT
ncbi:MAG TPA: M1 family metallopeptidase [Candidatus Saccharimonadales bacterium]|nr:M1 family metallopeptidase [Candidatus Saccharimonadales bacterium]